MDTMNNLEKTMNSEIAPVTPTLEKRTWHYLQHPAVFGYEPCEKCGNEALLWSEFKDHIWCDKCNVDFKPKYQGIFDGPIGMGAASLMGISFDRYDMLRERVERFDLKKLEWFPEKE